MSQPSPYLKLPGRGMRREGNFFISVMARKSALWLGVDHLLLVDSTIASQDLKRFYFRDIQAITVRKTHSGRTLNIVMAVLTAIASSITLGVNDPDGRIALFVIAGIFGVILLVNSLLGATCETHLQTAVQREQLPSLCRLRNARKVLRTLRPLLEQAQGQITAEEARARAATLIATPVAHSPMKPPAAPVLRPCRGPFHTVLFVLLLVDGLGSGAAIFFNSMAFALVQLVVLFGVVIALIGALIRQQDTDLPEGLRRLGKVIIGYLCVLMVVGLVINLVHAVQTPNVQTELAAIRYVASLDPIEHPWLLVLFAALCACSSTLGVIGLTLLSRYRRERPAMATVPPVATAPPRLPTAPPRLPTAPPTLPAPAVELAPPLPPPVAPAPPTPPPPPPAHG